MRRKKAKDLLCGRNFKINDPLGGAYLWGI